MRHDLEGARAAAERALEIAPDSTDTLNALAQVEVVSGNIPTAIALLRHSLELDPRQVETLTTLGSLFLLIDEPTPALECPGSGPPARTGRAAGADPSGPMPGRAEPTGRSGNPGTSKPQPSPPADAEVRLTEGMVLLNRGRFAEALSALQAAAELDPQNPEPLVNLAQLLRRRAMNPKPRCTPPARPLR